MFGLDQWEERPAILDALEGADDIYFDVVSQIWMPSWAQNGVALIGDACAAPSLLAGQGSELAMTAAYMLAGELKKADGDYGAAFRAYEQMLQPLTAKKQRAARSFASAFAPRTSFGIYFRNQITLIMTQPFIVKLFMGELLTDYLTLPAYWRMGKTLSPIRFEHFLLVTLPYAIRITAIVIGLACIVVAMFRARHV